MNKVTDITISQNSVVSLHSQLHNQLRQLILSGRWEIGSRIPSESTFTRALKISRSTVRLALQQAEIEGLIERFPGRGTFVASQTKGRDRRLIAFVTHLFDSESLLLMLKGAENAARMRGYQLILNQVENHQDEIETLHRLNSEPIAGILIWPDANASTPNAANEQHYRQITLPVVTIDRFIHGMECDCVTSDHYGGALAVMHHLLGLGHERIVFLTHYLQDLLAVKERYRAYCDALLAHGLQPLQPWLVGQPGNEISASYALRASVGENSAELQQIKNYMLTAQPAPTAIFALNDYIAIIASRAMKLLNYPIPDAISIVGFDDIDLAAHLDVPLTTVAQNPFAVGERAARRLFDRLEGHSDPVVCECLPTELRVRYSTAAPAGIARKEVVAVE